MRLTSLFLSSLLLGCNLMTGVDNLSIEESDEPSDGGSPSTGNGSSGDGNNTGTGGQTTAPTSAQTSTGSDTATSATNTTSTTSTTATGGPGNGTTNTGDGVQQSTTSGMQSCEYPGGPYGNTANKILSPNSSWTGYAPGGSSTTSLTAEDLFDCDGSKGINAVIFTMAQTTCGPCQDEAQNEIAPNLASWSGDGIVVVTLMYGGGSAGWRNAFNLEDSYVVDDYDGTFFTGNGDATPTNVIWDPRTATIVEWWQGSGGLQAAEQLAAQNAN